jgi:hypothetical protein
MAQTRRIEEYLGPFTGVAWTSKSVRVFAVLSDGEGQTMGGQDLDLAL